MIAQFIEHEPIVSDELRCKFRYQRPEEQGSAQTERAENKQDRES